MFFTYYQEDKLPEEMGIPMSADASAVEEVRMNQSFNEKVELYPNPYSEYFTLQIWKELELNNIVLNIYDLTGRIVNKKVLTSHTTQLDGDYINSGIYYYTLVSKEQVIASGKIVCRK